MWKIIFLSLSLGGLSLWGIFYFLTKHYSWIRNKKVVPTPIVNILAFAVSLTLAIVPWYAYFAWKPLLIAIFIILLSATLFILFFIVRYRTLVFDINTMKKKKNIPGLIAASRWGERLRYEAIKVLGDLRASKAAKYLFTEFSTSRSVDTAIALGKILRNKEALEPLRLCLKDVPYDGRGEEVVRVLEEIGEPAMEVLVEALKMGRPLRKHAVTALDKLGWKPKGIMEMMYYFCEKKEWDELVMKLDELIKEGGIELESIFRVYEISINLREIIKSLERIGKIGGAGAIKILIYILCRNPIVSMEENELIKLSKSAKKILVRIGEPAIELLINEFIQHRCSPMIAETMVEIGKPVADRLVQVVKNNCDIDSPLQFLVKIGDLRAIESLLNYYINNSWSLLNREGSFYNKGIYGWYPEYKSAVFSLLSGYDNLIWRINQFDISFHNYSKDTDTYQEEASCEIVKHLCSVKTPISDNILHLIGTQRDIRVSLLKNLDYIEHYYIEINLEQRRKMAKEELERRGNPPYDSSIYLNKEALKRECPPLPPFI